MKTSARVAILAVVVVACLCLTEGLPEPRLTRSKQQRPTRGFKNVEMMTARGFGKRDKPPSRAERDIEHQQPSERTLRGTPIFKSPSVGVARDFGKRVPEKAEENPDLIKFMPHSKLRSALDFGKRYDGDLPKFNPKSKLRTAIGFGKRGERFYENSIEESNKYDNSREYVPGTLLLTPDFWRRNENTNESNDEEEDQVRVTRGEFKANKILIARGFGKKRNSENKNVYNMENFWEALESSPEKDGQEGNDIKSESIPVDWFVNEMLNNPEFARAAVRKFIDLNQDDLLTSDELLRNVISK